MASKCMGGNMYLLPQFLNPSTNLRQDEYGGTPENRARIVVEVLNAIGTVWNHDRIGLKLSPAICHRFRILIDIQIVNNYIECYFYK